MKDQDRRKEVNDEYTAVAGITSAQIEELIQFSNSDEVVKMSTSDMQRFKNKNAFDEWIKKGRSIYTLNDINGGLKGIIWYGASTIPSHRIYESTFEKEKYGITFAIRIYEGARGKKLAKGFMDAAWDMYRNTDDYLRNPKNGIWLETNNDNLAAKAAYQRNGFKTVSLPDDYGRIIMISE